MNSVSLPMERGDLKKPNPVGEGGGGPYALSGGRPGGRWFLARYMVQKEDDVIQKRLGPVGRLHRWGGNNSGKEGSQKGEYDRRKETASALDGGMHSVFGKKNHDETRVSSSNAVEKKKKQLMEKPERARQCA